MMSKIRSKNTKPEIIIRKRLFAKGYRYTLHSKLLLGKPDIVLTKYKTVIFVNGCFWHMHDCTLFILPKTRTEFWKKKLARNKERDVSVKESLIKDKWRVATIWECSIKGKKDHEIDKVIDEIELWLNNSSSKELEIPNC
jgi:DNA mismatch endonuclease (patch repair protein)